MFDGQINAALKHTSDVYVTVWVKQRRSEQHVHSTAGLFVSNSEPVNGLVTEVCGVSLQSDALRNEFYWNLEMLKLLRFSL